LRHRLLKPARLPFRHSPALSGSAAARRAVYQAAGQGAPELLPREEIPE